MQIQTQSLSTPGHDSNSLRFSKPSEDPGFNEKSGPYLAETLIPSRSAYSPSGSIRSIDSVPSLSRVDAEPGSPGTEQRAVALSSTITVVNWDFSSKLG